MNLLVAFAVCCFAVSVSGYGEPIWVTGPASSWRDDSVSSAQCPEGYYVAECNCMDEDRCDGARVKDENIRVCEAVHRARVSTPTRAIAKCNWQAGFDVKAFYTNKELGEYLECPSGYQPESCSKLDAWSQDRRIHIQRSETGCALYNSERENTPTTSYYNKYAYVSLICITA